jgi:lysophospholipase L1-like esterase
VQRLRQALARGAPGQPLQPVTVTQRRGPDAGAPLAGDAALLVPPARGAAVNPNPQSLADVSELWGHARDTWTRQGAGLIGTRPAQQSWWVPVSRDHRAATLGSNGICGLHFEHEGSAFEVLFAGTDVEFTLLVDGRYAASPASLRRTLAAGLPGEPLNAFNAWLRIDLGARARRRLALYGRSTQGPCALAFAPGDRVAPLDRSAEPALAVLADSYGGAPSPNWGVSGPFWEAAALLGIPHLDLDALGGTGYAPNNANADTRNPGNAFPARVASVARGRPDLVIVAGGINDNNAFAAPPLYGSAEQARAGFEAAVTATFAALRAALPQAVLAATGPWAPRQQVPPDPVALSKAQTIRSALAADRGPWVFMDNLRGTWNASSGAQGDSGGPWQTGTGRAGAPAGDGNADLYLDRDGVHPNAAGSAYLGARIAADLRAALATL